MPLLHAPGRGVGPHREAIPGVRSDAHGGAVGGEGTVWRGLHSVTADLILPLLALHLAVHWEWIAGAVRRFIVKPILSRDANRKSETLPQAAPVPVEVE